MGVEQQQQMTYSDAYNALQRMANIMDTNSRADIHQQLLNVHNQIKEEIDSFLYSAVEKEVKDMVDIVEIDPNGKEHKKQVPGTKTVYVPLVPLKDWHPIVNLTGLNELKNYILSMCSPLVSTTNYDSLTNIKENASIVAKKAVKMLIFNQQQYGFEVSNASRSDAFGALVYVLAFSAFARSQLGFYYKGIVQNTNINVNKSDMPAMPQKKGGLFSLFGNK